MQNDISKSVVYLNQGKIILCPTDTIWGLSCDPFNFEAVKSIIKIKGRKTQKPFILLIDKMERLKEILETIPVEAEKYFNQSNKPTTIIFHCAKKSFTNICAEDGSIAIRLIKHGFCHELIHQFNKPLLSTSANFSGKHHPEKFNDIEKKIIESVDYVVKYGQDDILRKEPSRIVKISKEGKTIIIRE